MLKLTKFSFTFPQKKNQEYDNGIFWIDYRSILNFFDVFYVNWDPNLFSHTYCIHASWSAGVGPTKDVYTIGDNPQYSLRIAPGKGSVWVLLTRHITSIEDFRENHEYITLLVYQNGGKRIYYPRKNRSHSSFVKKKCQITFLIRSKRMIFSIFR